MALPMEGNQLVNVVVLLGAAVIAVPIFKRLGLGSVLGYLAAGLAIGPFGIGFFSDPKSILHVAELGVVMFLFIIGLEMQPSRLWKLRGEIFGLGLAQVVVCGGLLTVVGLLAGLSGPAAFMAAMGFVLSSTAIVMQILGERDDSTSAQGQRIVSILLLEDLAIVPGISANVPRILIEEGQHGAVTWVIEQGAVGGVPLLEFQFGCASNAEAIVPSPYQFTYFQGAGFDMSLLSFLQIDRQGCVNVSKLGVRPHVTAGAGGFIDITARAKRIVFSGYFSAAAKLAIADGKLVIEKEGRVKKLVEAVEHISFSGPRAVAQGQEVTYITERCVMRLTPEGIVITEIAPGVDLERDILAQSEFPLLVPRPLKLMDAALFDEALIGLEVPMRAA